MRKTPAQKKRNPAVEPERAADVVIVGKFFGQCGNDRDVGSTISQTGRQNAKRYTPSYEGVIVAVEREDLWPLN